MSQIKVYDVECAWVPGTTDRVRFRLTRSGKKTFHVRELAISKLTAMFGRSLLEDLYLRGRAKLSLSDHQLSELAF